MSDAETKTDDMPTEHWVYIGPARIKGSKTLGYEFGILDASGKLTDDRRLYERDKISKAFDRCRPGGVYSIKANATTCRPGSVAYVEMFQDKAQVAAWQVAAQATQTADRARKNEAKETGAKYMVEVLAPLRDAYRSTDELGRRAIEVEILKYLRSW